MIQVDQSGINHSLSDEELIRQAQQGSLEAFTTLYDRYLPVVYKWVRYVVQAQDVEDITQEVFISLLKSLKGFKGNSRFSTWLRTLTKRRVADYYRSRGDVEANLDLSDAEALHTKQTPDNMTTMVVDDRVILRRALKDLPEHYRDILIFRFGEGLQFSEIASQTGQSLEATKSLFRRALVALRQQMGEEAHA
jgi:RNA polymerase sigma-70 factor (ECF subfamily)